MKHTIIGCGGIGSWLLPKMLRLIPAQEITVIDGDTVTKRNLDRQVFDRRAIGRNKATALAEKYPGLAAQARYFAYGDGEAIQEPTILWCCVDNHAARRAVLAAIDHCPNCAAAIIGANEYTDSEAYLYLRSWRGTALDPRVRYPAILTDQANDPTAPCQGEAAQESAPQLALANDTSAVLMLRLYYARFIWTPPGKVTRMFANVYGVQTEKGELTNGHCIP
jgi:hypothetical protein